MGRRAGNLETLCDTELELEQLRPLNTERYDDEYATCAETYATLRVYDVDPKVVTNSLGIRPSNTQVAEQKMYAREDSPRFRLDGWFLTTEGVVGSRDSRRHIDWLLDRIEPVANQLQELRAKGARVDISCFWASASGHGGPGIPPNQAKRLGTLDLEIWFDVYFLKDDL